MRESGKGKAAMKTQPRFERGEQVMYGSNSTGWDAVTIIAVDFASIAGGEELAYTIRIGNAERSTVASKLCAMKAFGTSIGTAMALEDTEAKMATALSDSDGEMLEVMEDAVRDEAGDIEMGDDMGNDGSKHLLDAPEQELQDGGSIFQRDDTQGGCNLTGQYKAGRGVVPWAGQHDEGWGAEEDSTQMQGIEQLDMDEGDEAGPPQLRGYVLFDRTRHMRSAPWCSSGARVRLVDCTDPKLRDGEGVVEW